MEVLLTGHTPLTALLMENKNITLISKDLNIIRRPKKI
jgi:hypothetical protein